jgi:hypothetical protein
MKVSAQSRALTALLLGKDLAVLTGLEVLVASGLVGMLWRKENTLPMPEIEPQFIGHAACSLVSKLTELFQLYAFGYLKNIN